jgi:peptidyl-prolyl cis-trans isomerase A (cyclophilin A)
MNGRTRSAWIMACCGIAIFCVAGWISAQQTTGAEDYFLPPVGLEPGWYARIETSKGRIIALLHPDQAPQSVTHFVGLAEGTLEWTDPILGEPQKGRFYDKIHVDLAKAGERFEAGGLEADPSRTPPVIYVSPAEGKGPVNFAATGRLGMTSSYGSRISAVKFFVTAAPAPYFNNHYPCFGSVVEGLSVVRRITEVKAHSGGRPIEPVEIHKIRIFAIGDPEPLPEPEPYRPQLVEMETSKEPMR